MAKVKTYSVRFPIDQTSSKWLEKQGNKTMSLEMLIRAAVKKYGYEDLPSSVIDSIGLDIKGSAEDMVEEEPNKVKSKLNKEELEEEKSSEDSNGGNNQKEDGVDAKDDKPDIDLGMLTNLK